MLREKFNKLGGTEIRVKHQINFYLMLCEWIKNEQVKSLFSLEEWNNKFKEWTKKEDIYNYKNDKIIKNRFNFIKNNLKKIGIKYIENKFNIPSDINDKVIFKNLIKYKNNNVYPFKEMIDFALQNPKLNDAKKIIIAFMVFDGNETFKSLYHKNVVEEIVNNSKLEIPNFKKPINEQKFIDLIFNKKTNKEIITVEDMIEYSNTNQKNYIKPIFLKNKEKFNLSVLVERINKISRNDFVRGIIKNRIKQVIYEYLDLNSRWLHDFHLVDVSGKKTIIFYNKKIFKINNQYEIKAKENIIEYPFSELETIDYITSIANDDFTFKSSNDNLKFIANSVIAEYFVNLYYVYKLKIIPKNFIKFVNTKVNSHFYPIFTAPGKVADMSYYNENITINIETTILSTNMQIKKNEIFPCSEHSVKSFKEHQTNNNYLIFISPINPLEIDEDFQLVFKGKNKKSKNSKLIICTFDDLMVPQI